MTKSEINNLRVGDIIFDNFYGNTKKLIQQHQILAIAGKIVFLSRGWRETEIHNDNENKAEHLEKLGETLSKKDLEDEAYSTTFEDLLDKPDAIIERDGHKYKLIK